MELLFLILSSIIFIFFLHALNLHRNRRMPPVPVGFPIIGNLLDIGPKPHHSLAKLSQKYGPLMTIRLGSITSVVASTPDAARQILQLNDKACSGRFVPDAVTALDNYDSAFLWMSTNQDWRTGKKALNTYLTHQHKLDTLGELRQTVVEGMLQFLGECGRKKEVVDIGKLAFAVALNMMSTTSLSRNVTNYESEDVGGFKATVKTIMEVVGKFNVGDIFPVLKPFDFQNIRGKAKVAYGWLDKVTEDFISERLKLRLRESKVEKCGDLLDSLLDYSQDHEAVFGLKHVKVLLLGLFIEGTETSSNTIEWAMTELLINPCMFSKVRQEVSTVVRADGKIEEAKVLNLPYLNAVIKETMRLHLSVPLLLPHKTETEVKLGEYIVPKNTRILVNAWAMARDPRYWETPTIFKPERFLENNIDYKGKHFKFIPFGSGQRICPGMPLAHRVVSLMVASFVYHFDWKLPHDPKEMDMNDIFGITLLRATPLLATPVNMK